MKEYITYKCKVCNKTFILLASEAEHNENQGNYITCPFRGHKNIVVTGAYDSIKEVMDNHVFVREGRRTRQIK